MSDLESATFGDLLSYPLRSGVTVPKEQRGSGIKMINMGELFRHPRLGDVDMARVDINYQDQDRYLVRQGDLLFARRSLTAEGAGKCAIVIEVPSETTWESSIIRARLNEDLADPLYYYYFFRSPLGRSAIEGITEQVAAAGIRSSDLRNLAVPKPSLVKQQSIAALLGALDDKIAVNERIAATTRQLGLALFSQASLGGDLMQGVDVASVASALTRGIAPKYSESIDDLVVLNQKCVRSGRVNLAPARRTLSERVKDPKLLRRNDVLVNSTGVGTLGRVARWTSDEPATVDSHITIVRFDEKRVDPVCAGFALLLAQPEIEEMGEGSTGQTELRRTQLGGLKITLPSRTRQQLLRADLDALEEQADQALTESETLAAFRDTLLPQLMSGRLRVKDAEKIVEDHT